MNPATPNPALLNRLPGNVTHHLHGTPVSWATAAHGQMHFCGGENGNLRAWALGADRQSAYLGCSSAVASADSPRPPGGMPGWSIALSANENQNGVLWAIIPYGDANMELTNGRLLAYDAANIVRFADGSGEIIALWDSRDWGWNFLHPKFNRPIAVGGKVIVPTYDGRVFVLGLALTSPNMRFGRICTRKGVTTQYLHAADPRTSLSHMKWGSLALITKLPNAPFALSRGPDFGLIHIGR